MNEFFTGTSSFIWWQGVVEDNNDPLMAGRCRVRVLGFHNSDKIQLPTEHLPWATIIQPVTSAAMNGIGTSPSGLLQGTWVVGFFRDGSLMQEPIIMGSIGGIPINKIPASQGFSDPSGKYPKDDYLNEPDTNRLSRNANVEKTIVQLKTVSAEKNVNAAMSSETWDEPAPAYNATYPKNHVLETESGHVQEFDDTPNNERIHTYHKSGTFEEIYPTGSTVKKIVGDNYEIILENDRILIKGTKSENISGNNNIKIGKNLNIQIEGDANVVVGGNSTIETKGNHFHKIKGSCGIVSEGNMVLMAPRIDLNPNGVEASSIDDIF